MIVRRIVKLAAAPTNGYRVVLHGTDAVIEYRPKLGMFDVMRPGHYGPWRQFPTRIHRTNDLFAAISSARSGKPSC